jgi:hypothetical protein
MPPDHDCRDAHNAIALRVFCDVHRDGFRIGQIKLRSGAPFQIPHPFSGLSRFLLRRVAAGEPFRKPQSRSHRQRQ